MAPMPATAAGNVVPMAHYHRAAILDRLGEREQAREARAAARAADPTRCFPSGLDDHDALRAAIDADPDDRRAAALLGVDPVRCLVLEDAASGIAAGRAAGARVVGVGPRRHPGVVAWAQTPGHVGVDRPHHGGGGAARVVLEPAQVVDGDAKG